jgi:hypothetical protein
VRTSNEAGQLPLNSKEAIDFFRSFLEELTALCLENIDPIQIQHALETTTSLAGNKMKLFSRGLQS